MPVSTGLDRLWGLPTQERIQELKRQAVMALSEAVEEPSADPGIPRQVDVLRYTETVAPSPSTLTNGTWTLVAGLTNLTAFVRTHGRWRREEEDRASDLRDSERIITIADIPATGAGLEAVGQSVLTLGDRLRYQDESYGISTFKVTAVRPRTPAQLCTCLVEYAREGN